MCTFSKKNENGIEVEGAITLVTIQNWRID